MRPELVDAEEACAVIATIGTTGMTSIDPVPEIASLCAAAGTWLHVDAAYAGPAAMLPELRKHFAGWELADSIGLNPHKWLGVPIDCSVLWTRRTEDFRDAFSLVPEYLRSPDDVLSLSEVSIPLGRRFRALKLWAVLRCYGVEGLQSRLREHLRLAELFESWVRAEPGWEVTAPRHFSLVCFRREGSDEDNERILERVNDSGEVFLSHTRFAGRYQLRLAIGNFRTTEDDVQLAWEVLSARQRRSEVQPQRAEHPSSVRRRCEAAARIQPVLRPEPQLRSLDVGLRGPGCLEVDAGGRHLRRPVDGLRPIREARRTHADDPGVEDAVVAAAHLGVSRLRIDAETTSWSSSRRVAFQSSIAPRTSAPSVMSPSGRRCLSTARPT
jgi:hypothetical protein